MKISSKKNTYLHLQAAYIPSHLFHMEFSVFPQLRFDFSRAYLIMLFVFCVMLKLSV